MKSCSLNHIETEKIKKRKLKMKMKMKIKLLKLKFIVRLRLKFSKFFFFITGCTIFIDVKIQWWFLRNFLVNLRHFMEIYVNWRQFVKKIYVKRRKFSTIYVNIPFLTIFCDDRELWRQFVNFLKYFKIFFSEN
jgi:hypothetical protein